MFERVVYVSVEAFEWGKVEVTVGTSSSKGMQLLRSVSNSFFKYAYEATVYF